MGACVSCSGPGVSSGISGVCCHRCPLYHHHAHCGSHPGVLPLLWKLWREDVPEANVLHSLSQENSLLERLHHHSHYLVSVCVLCISTKHNDVLSEISIPTQQLESARLTACLLPFSDWRYVHDSNCLFSCVCVCNFVFVCVCVYAFSAGNVCMFRSNEALKKTVDQTAEGIGIVFDNVNTFLLAVPVVRKPSISKFNCTSLVSFLYLANKIQSYLTNALWNITSIKHYGHEEMMKNKEIHEYAKKCWSWFTRQRGLGVCVMSFVVYVEHVWSMLFGVFINYTKWRFLNSMREKTGMWVDCWS